MKVCILSGRYPHSSFNSSVNHKVYADKYNYTYINCNWPNKVKNPYLNKIYYILEYIDYFDYIFWIDDDAFFWDFDRDIMDFIPENECLFSFCKSPEYKELKTFLSSGQFLFKVNIETKTFFKELLNISLSAVKEWWTPDLGYFSNGDQDIIIYMFKNYPQYQNKYKLYDYKEFNSRYDNLYGIDKHTPFILHFTGRQEVKQVNYNKVQKDYNLHSSLVKEAYLKMYSLKEASKKKGFFKRLKVKLYNFRKCLSD